MAKNIFTNRFCDIVKKQVCTTSAELDFDELTTPGTYEIYEDMGNGQNRVYFLTVDKSASGKCLSQTRTHCGKVEYRHYTTAGTWTEWTEKTGSGNLDGKEDKSNKSAHFNINESFPTDDERYPNFYALYGAILQGNDIVRDEFEEQKGYIITGEGVPTDPSEEKLGQLYYDELSTPPAVYVCAKLGENDVEWLPVDAMGRDAYDIAASNSFEIYVDTGHIASNYQDKSYKTTTISAESTDEDYPSAKAVYDGIQAKTGWELLKSDTLTSAVTNIELNLPTDYKELFWRFTVPTLNESKASDFSKARTYLYVNDGVVVADDQAFHMQDSGYDWYLSYHVQKIGHYCSVFKGFHSRAERIDTTAYTQDALPYVTWQPGKDIKAYSINKVKVLMYSETSGVRKFPVGTKYEIWGVKA